ncbi:hypothetical protein ACHAW5_004284 [Stephanodiscus triporus]|uniref:DNA helicase n=1 Tax=Stephanodiscus triporus TaxID=2934178 RepID=A0ABD3MLT4_9STRA
MSATSHVIGKSTKKELVEALKKASAQLKQTKKPQNREKKVDVTSPVSPIIKNHAGNDQDKVDDMNNKAPIRLLEANEKIQDALKWYNALLNELVFNIKDESLLHIEDDLELSSAGATAINEPIKKPRVVLTLEQVAAALSHCDSEDTLANVETGVDLFQWDSHSVWTIDITEQAHKFFQKHIKKDKALCERIIRRLTLLATGQWPYVLCKSLKSKSIGKYGKKINLYETKIDSASRIIWEVAIAFSPRRSSLDQSYCEQVIRVWAIVLDHDNLARAIDQTIDRIEQSHLRGEDCAICAELVKSQNRPRPSQDTIGVTRIPRVFPMSNEMSCSGPSATDQTAKERTRHFHPASDDPRQFTLLKLRQLFLTKNDVLCREVERSFNNMGLAWRKRCGAASNKNACTGEVGSVTGLVNSKLTKFMTSSEWLEALDMLLPGQKFFSPQEIEQRSDERKLKDTVTRGEVLAKDQFRIMLKHGLYNLKQGGYYDECDLVYNIAGRISLLDVSYFDHMDQESVLPVDSLFVDECQDWTQAELYVLAKLCGDPNALFLAGDTAQSIAVGVDFRFTDVRQTFYNHFGGLEPELLQLSHNYRSHAGVLRLAACVVELIYFFFSTSLDKLPPDLGLFDGPKPIIMKVASTADLILMLDGAKRETSRIEFGAHQVVIVRSDEAKKNCLMSSVLIVTG